MPIRWLVGPLLLASVLLPLPVGAQFVEEETAEGVRSAGNPATPDPLPDLTAAARRIVRKTNAFRQAQGLREVSVAPQLQAAAQDFADYMAREDEYGHQADGRRPAERAADHGYDYCLVAENIAYTYDSSGLAAQELARTLFRGWKQSPGHRENMLDPDVFETGVALARSEQTGYYYAVQMFGRPKSRMIQFQVANRADAEVEYELAGRTYSLPPRMTRTHGRCRPAELTMQWPNEQESASVQPNDGDHYTVVRQDGAWQLQRE